MSALAKVHRGAADNSLHAVRDKYSGNGHFQVALKHTPVTAAAMDVAKTALHVDALGSPAPSQSSVPTVAV